MIMDKDYGAVPAKMEEPLRDVFESSERLIVLVNDLLDVSRITSGRMELHIEAVDIYKLTLDVIEEIKPKAEAKNVPINLDNKTHNSVVYVRGDSEKLRQVIINLIDNAIKYTDKGGVTVGFEILDDHNVRFSVKDNGIGISADELPQLFHRFMRTEEAKLTITEGTGLGLYVAKTIIDALSGRIWAESEGLGKGSTFIFELPAATANLAEQVVKVQAKNDYAQN